MARSETLGLVAALALAGAASAAELTPANQALTPTAAPGALFQPLNPELPGDPAYTAGQAAAPEVAGLAVSPDGGRLLAANIQNASVSLIDLATGAVTEQDLRPGVIDPVRIGQVGGTFPRAVAWTSDRRAYVASERDRE